MIFFLSRLAPFMLFRALWTGTLVKKYTGDGHILNLGATAFLRPHIHGVAFQDAFADQFPGTLDPFSICLLFFDLWWRG
jgi:hypothetical protein